VAMLFLPRVQQFSDDSSRGFFTPVEAPADKPHLGCSVSSWDVGILGFGKHSVLNNTWR